MISGLEKESSGTIYIPTTQDLEISNNDIVIEETAVLPVKSVGKKSVSNINQIEVRRLSVNEENPDDEFYSIYKNKKIQKYRVVSVDDNRKGNLQHYKLGVSE